MSCQLAHTQSPTHIQSQMISIEQLERRVQLGIMQVTVLNGHLGSTAGICPIMRQDDAYWILCTLKQHCHCTDVLWLNISPGDLMPQYLVHREDIVQPWKL